MQQEQGLLNKLNALPEHTLLLPELTPVYMLIRGTMLLARVQQNRFLAILDSIRIWRV